MNTSKRYLFIGLMILAGVVTLVGLTWVNYRYSQQSPGGSDFLPRWVGTREFLMKGLSPYSDETTQEIQQRFYGRPAESDEDQVLFVYPFYSIFIFSPFALIEDFTMARAVWMTVLEVGIVLIALGGISLCRWKISSLMLGFLLIFSLLSYYSIRPLINSNASVLVGLFVVGALLAIRAEQDSWAGLLLALATIKPQVVLLLILFILIWSLAERRHILFWSILGSLALMTAITSLLIPDWTWQNSTSGDELSILHLARDTWGDFHPLDARGGPAVGVGAVDCFDCDPDLGMAAGIGENRPLVSLGGLFNPDRDNDDRNSHGDRELHRTTTRDDPRICGMGPGMGCFWKNYDRNQLLPAAFRSLVDFSSDSGARCAADPEFSGVFPFAGIPVDRIILDPMVGAPPRATAA